MTDGRAQALEFLLDGDESGIEVAERFDSTEVTIRVGPGSERLALGLANLLVRVGTRLRLEGGCEIPSAPSRLDHDLKRFIESRPAQGSDRPTPSTKFVVDVGVSGTNADLYVSSDGWNLSLSRKPHSVLEGSGPAVVAAGALVASIIFRELLPELPSTALGDARFDWNLVNYELGHTVPFSSEGTVEATCFGGGSVGSSIIYALVLSGAEGVIDLVDPDTLEERNRWRYPALLSEPQGAKTDWLKGLAADSMLQVNGHQTDAAGYIFDLEGPEPTLAISAVDSIAARRDITDLLARTTINIGVNRLFFHVSRHLFGDDSGCLYCPFLDVSDPADEVDIYAEMSGLSHERIRKLLYGDAISEADLAVMPLSSSGDAREFRDDFRAFVREHLYAQAPIFTSAGEVAVSAPFVSALAGSLAAAEVLKEASGGHNGVDRRIDVDCSGFPTGFQRAVPRDDTRKCLCWDQRRLKKYAFLWGRQPSAFGERNG